MCKYFERSQYKNFFQCMVDICFGRPQHGTKVFEMLDDFLIGDLAQ